VRFFYSTEYKNECYTMLKFCYGTNFCAQYLGLNLVNMGEIIGACSIPERENVTGDITYKTYVQRERQYENEP
jgi:hypothetical protein